MNIIKAAGFAGCILLALATSAAHASLPNRDDSLDAILANRGVLVEAPSVMLHSVAGPFSASLLSVCLDRADNQLRLVARTVRSCLKGRTLPRRGAICTQYGYVTPVAPVVVNQTSCERWNHRFPRDARPTCARWIETTVDYSLPVELKVRRLLAGRGGVRVPSGVLFTKTFQIPACQ